MQRIRIKDGRRRRLLVREAARLQSFPDWFGFTGNETSQFYQIGNAVPPLLSYQLALSIKACYNSIVNLSTHQTNYNSLPINKRVTLF